MILTRKFLDGFDTNPMYAGVAERRYLCPSSECCDKPRDNSHRSLTVRDDGVYQCFRCSMKGRLGDEQASVTTNASIGTRKRRSIRDVMR